MLHIIQYITQYCQGLNITNINMQPSRHGQLNSLESIKHNCTVAPYCDLRADLKHIPEDIPVRISWGEDSLSTQKAHIDLGDHYSLVKLKHNNAGDQCH